MDVHEYASQDALEKVGSGDLASSVAAKPLYSFSFTPLTKPQCVHRIGRFKFNDDQLNYAIVNLEHGGGINTTYEVVVVLRYKWPNRFRTLLESDLEMVIEWLSTYIQARKPGCEVGRIDEYTYGQPQNPEGGWPRVFGRQQNAFRLPKLTRLINTFKIELREAQVSDVRALAKAIEPRIVLVILASKFFLDLSSADVALGLTHRCSKLFRGYRYVWLIPFEECHVETVWYRSQLAQTESFKLVAGMDRQQSTFRRLLISFMEDVESGRADERLWLDPRSCGNERSAADLVEEIISLFLEQVASKDVFEALMAE